MGDRCPRGGRPSKATRGGSGRTGSRVMTSAGRGQAATDDGSRPHGGTGSNGMSRRTGSGGRTRPVPAPARLPARSASPARTVGLRAAIAAAALPGAPAAPAALATPAAAPRQVLARTPQGTDRHLRPRGADHRHRGGELGRIVAERWHDGLPTTTASATTAGVPSQHPTQAGTAVRNTHQKSVQTTSATSRAPAPPVPAPTTPAAVAAPPASAAPASCHPLTNAGNCYEPGEYCRDADHDASGVAGDGKAITCEDNDGWRWEPA